MLTAVLLLAAGLAAADDKELKPFVFGRKAPDPVPAAAFDKVRDGMTLREVVDLLGPGYIPNLSGTGNLRWTCADGRALTASHATDPGAALTAAGGGTKRNPWMGMGNKAANDRVPPPQAAPPYTDAEAAAFAE